MSKGALPRPGHPSDAYEHAQGNADIDTLEVVLPGTLHDDFLAVSLSSDGRHINFEFSRQVLSGKALRRLHEFEWASPALLSYPRARQLQGPRSTM